MVRALRLPWLAACVPAAERITHQRAEQKLITSVKRRLRRREIANAAPYAELVNWVERILCGEPVVNSGDLEWDFYGDRFDTRLFELWCLRLLAVEISRQLVVAVPELDPRWRDDRPAYTWNQYAGTLELYFQRSLPRVSSNCRARWQRDDGTPLGGMPDIVVKTVRSGKEGYERLAVIDPKLRQRGAPPAEELYKILGYLDNFSLSTSPLGAILFHTNDTEDLSGYTYYVHEQGKSDHPSSTSGKNGALYAIRLNPASRDESQRALAPLATAILGLLDIPPLDRYASEENEDEGELFYRAKKAELQAFTATVSAQLLKYSRHRVRVILGDARWEALGGTAQAMLATAEYIGFSLLGDSDAENASISDYSGPVIGICASLESTLHDGLITPATAHSPQLQDACARATFGQVIALIEESLKDKQPQPRHQAIRAYLDASGADREALRALVEPLRQISRNFRNPAAHRDRLTQRTWTRLWRAVLVEDKILARVIEALALVPSAVDSDDDTAEAKP